MVPTRFKMEGHHCSFYQVVRDVLMYYGHYFWPTGTARETCNEYMLKVLHKQGYYIVGTQFYIFHISFCIPKF